MAATQEIEHGTTMKRQQLAVNAIPLAKAAGKAARLGNHWSICRNHESIGA
jgi:hypothetical protein